MPYRTDDKECLLRDKDEEIARLTKKLERRLRIKSIGFLLLDNVEKWFPIVFVIAVILVVPVVLTIDCSLGPTEEDCNIILEKSGYDCVDFTKSWSKLNDNCLCRTKNGTHIQIPFPQEEE